MHNRIIVGKYCFVCFFMMTLTITYNTHKSAKDTIVQMRNLGVLGSKIQNNIASIQTDAIICTMRLPGKLKLFKHTLSLNIRFV